MLFSLKKAKSLKITMIMLIRMIIIMTKTMKKNDYFDMYEEEIYEKFKKLFQEQVVLHIAVQNNSISLVKLLFQNSKIIVNIQFVSNDEEKNGKIALHFAVVNENVGYIKLLLENQFIDVDIKDYKRNTPLE